MFNFLDLFAGCGGLSLGLMSAGGRGIFAIERNADAFSTLRRNLIEAGHAEMRYSWPKWLPLKEHGIVDLITQYRCELESLRGEVDAVVGGPPCQGYSVNGRRDIDDPRNTLFQHYVEVVNAVRPRVVLLENVRGIDLFFKERSRENTSRTVKFASLIQSSLEEAGYVVHPLYLCASNFGVPQKRNRFFLLGIRSNVPAARLSQKAVEGKIEDSRVAFLDSVGLATGTEVSASDAISDLEVGHHLEVCPDFPRFSQPVYKGPQTEYQNQMRAGMNDQRIDSARLANHKSRTIEKFRTIQQTCVAGAPLGEDDRERLGMQKLRTFLLCPHSPSYTVTTLPDDILHYSEPRILSVRENARLQSFPDWFEFCGPYTTGGKRRANACPRYTQVGNAVPVRLAQVIGRSINEMLSM